MTRLLRGATVLGLLAIAVVPAGPAQAASDLEFHNLLFGSGLANVPVDVCIDGTQEATSLASGGSFLIPSTTDSTPRVLVSATEPLTPCDAKTTVLLDEEVTVADGSIIVAHNGRNDVGGAQPELSVIPPPDCVDDGYSRLSVFHGANAGPVEIESNGSTVVSGVSNGQYEGVDLPRDTFGLTRLLLSDTSTLLSETNLSSLAGAGPREFIFLAYGGVGATPELRLLDNGVIEREVPVCGTAPTTQAPTTSAPAPTSTTPGSGPITATPRFAG